MHGQRPKHGWRRMCLVILPGWSPICQHMEILLPVSIISTKQTLQKWIGATHMAVIALHFPPKPDLISISRGYRARRILLQCVANMFPVNWVIYYQFDSFPTFSTKTPLISASPVICHPRNSRANCNRKYMNGRFANVYGVWGKRHRELRTPLVVLENTEETHPRTHRHFVGEGSWKRRWRCHPLVILSTPLMYQVFKHLMWMISGDSSILTGNGHLAGQVEWFWVESQVILKECWILICFWRSPLVVFSKEETDTFWVS